MDDGIIDPTQVDSKAERKEGVENQGDALSLNMDDEAIASAIGNRVEKSEAYWNETLKLDSVRDKNEKYYLGTYFDPKKLYDFQVPYQDNRIFISIETVIPLALANPPQPQCVGAYDTEASQELARMIERWLLGKYEDLYLKQKFMMVARHLLIGYRLAVKKVRWNDQLGELQEDGTHFGDVDVDVKRPQRIVLDTGAQDIDDIPLIGEYLSCTIGDLCEKYPNKEKQIYDEMGGKSNAEIKMHAKVGYVETWFDYHDDKGHKISAVAWKFRGVVLDSMKNPNWNYEEKGEDGLPTNFFDRPKKPYILFNFLNSGRYVIDDTSITDQAGLMQEVLDKRGRQIVENADQANAGLVLNGAMIKATEAAKLLGDPGEKIMSNGDVRMAAARLPINLLPDYVLADRQDARSEIDNFYGTHGAVRGEVTKSKTLGQDVLSQRGDSSRIQTLATSIEDGADREYKYMVQMAKVFYDIPQLQRYSTPDSGTSFAAFGRDQIQPGAKIRVKTGSVLPEDRIAKREETVQLMAILDPLSIAEGLNKPNPKEFAKRMLYYRVFPDKYMTEVLEVDPTSASGTDPSASQEIEVMNSGKEAPPQQHPTKEHLSTHQAFMESPQFKQLPPEIQQLHLMHVKAELENAKGEMGLKDKPGMPPEKQQPTAEQPAPTGTPADAAPESTMKEAGAYI